MNITTRKRALALVALGASSALVLAGCGSAPEETGGNDAASDFLACMVSDEGGFDDKSFNELSYNGLQTAAEEIGFEAITVQSASEADYDGNITNLVDEGCQLIFTVGFALAAATIEHATDNPEIEFAIIDDAADADFDGETDAENIKPILFNTADAAFLAGYAAASYSESGKVGTFGGQPFPTVTIFMDGFKQGVEYYNEQKGEAVEVLGWDGENGQFVGSFSAGTQALTIAQGLIDQGADVVFPVGGPIYQSAVQAIRDSGESIALIGADADITVTDPENADLFLTSVLKRMDVAVEETTLAVEGGSTDTTAYIGTLENDGVGLAPFHDFEDAVDPALQDEIDALIASILDGDVVVESYLAQ